MRVIRLARMLLAVSVIHPTMLRAFAVATAIASAATILDVANGPRAMKPLLLLQVFAAATGFAVPARRGHYDLVLTRGDSRWRLGVMHWILSVGPGIASWGVLTAVEGWCGGTTLRASNALVALLLASTLPWACNVRLPRLTAAIAWVVLGGAATTVLPVAAFPVMGVVAPWQLPESAWKPTDASVAWAFALAVAGTAMTAALISIGRMDVALESAQ